MLIDTSPVIEPYGPKTSGRFAVFPGDRERVVTRVDPELARRIRVGAANAKLSVSEFTARLLGASMEVWEAEVAKAEEETPMRLTG